MRKKTRTIRIGRTAIGGEEPVRIQSMTNTDTADIEATAAQIAALEAAGGNVLDAVILLEQQGKTGPTGGDYSTRGAGPEPDGPVGRRAVNWREVRRALKSLLTHCLAISLEIWKGGRMTCMIPLIVALILCLVAPYAVFGLALLGLCFGYTIHISGKGTEGWGDKVNQVMDQIGDVVSDAVGQFRRDRKNKRQKK